VPIEVVSWRLTAQGPEDRAPSERPLGDAAAQPAREKSVPLWPAAGPAKVYARASLGRGQPLAGPALIEERETTIVLPPGWTAVVDDSGCITATRSA
jgi:N-methylhydantoinase A